MSAETLRRAAKTLRQRAAWADDATLNRPWAHDGTQVIGGGGGWFLVATAAGVDAEDEDRMAGYIATMDPRVGLALADLLDVEWALAGLQPVWPSPSLRDQTFAELARLILGGES